MMFDVQVLSWNTAQKGDAVGDAQRPSGRISGFPRSHTTFLMEFRQGLAKAGVVRHGWKMETVEKKR